ncbi:hypothetical protein EV356DRAFT_538477 [Viridothelium virens]|uniref:HTH CENPB-type domain-containing protein n=1 Tax=Viridothelium virens TaxID=1048519 RepID=A0A6A6GS55_VIRVR|nr:hypothetical protein EV356DRAFT_538477 [Viridothelium virens]
MVQIWCENITGSYPRKNWVSRFVNLHTSELSSDFISAIDLNQVRADNPTQIELYFDLTYLKVEQHGILPKNTYNLDEKGFLIGCLQKQR